MSLGKFACFVIFILFFSFALAEMPGEPVVLMPQIKAFDINKDGKAEVTYYKDGEYVGKVEADTNSDGKSDIIVHLKDGKFQDAAVDIDYDGKADKEFKDKEAFIKWVNENKPDYADKLNQANWKFDLVDF
ncbi:MAG: hypothetical protein NTY47_05565 [Candidatus Omnitrophica bacterium]|nr:hypothetical protein [Candidatus Omnitrophota bacterium]